MEKICERFKIKHHNSVPYRPNMNGVVEAANKNVKKIMAKMTDTYKDWHEKLPSELNRRKETQGFMSQSIIPKTDDTSS